MKLFAVLTKFEIQFRQDLLYSPAVSCTGCPCVSWYLCLTAFYHEHHAVLCIDTKVPPASLSMRFVVRNRGLYLHLTMLNTVQYKMHTINRSAELIESVVNACEAGTAVPG